MISGFGGAGAGDEGGQGQGVCGVGASHGAQHAAGFRAEVGIGVGLGGESVQGWTQGGEDGRTGADVNDA